MAVDVKRAYRSLFEEAFGKGRYEVYDEVCDASYRGHDPVTGDADLAQMKEVCRMYRGAFPDMTATILGCYADGDTVVAHWRMSGTHQKELMNIAPTGTRCTVEGMSIGRFRGGRLVEEWTQWDCFGLMRQLGAAQPIGATETAMPRSTTRPHA